MTLKCHWQLAVFLCLAIEAHAQEPALFTYESTYPRQALRYEESPGVFHYIAPCAQRIDESKPGQEPALCWPVNAIRLRKVEGKTQTSAAVSGILTVSSARVRFIPLEWKDIEYWQEIPTADAQFVHLPGRSLATVISKDGGVGFGFSNFCSGCKTGVPALNPLKTSQLDAEYGNVSDSLTGFDTVYRRVRDESLQLRVTVEPRNQPTPDDVPAAMELYSALNQRLAQVCQELAKSCIQSYRAYEACKSGASGTECPAPPTCTAVCALPHEVWQVLPGGACVSPGRDSAGMFPDWSDELKKEDAQRAANASGNSAPVRAGVPGGVLGVLGGVAGMAGMGGGGAPTHYPGWAQLAIVPGGKQFVQDFPSAAGGGTCSAAFSYTLARNRHLSGGDPVSFIGNVPTVSITAAPPPTNGVSQIPGGIMAGNLLEKTPPVYPAVAKAAHVTGSVVLHAIIARDGTIKSLEVVSGPPLLRSSAIDAVKQWRYKPYLLNGVPVEVDTTITVNYNFAEPTPPPPPQ